MSQSDEREAWSLRFTVEVAARYHDWRRATLGTVVNIVRASALLGAVMSIIAVNNFGEHVVIVITAVSVLVAIITLFDLVFGIDLKAREHNDLYRRCTELLASVLRADTGSDLSDLESQAQVIWRDEPPTYWAVYAICWNQTVEKHRVEATYRKKIGWLKMLVRNLWQFRPQDFPELRQY